jgi:hypothetical protein
MTRGPAFGASLASVSGRRALRNAEPWLPPMTRMVSGSRGGGGTEKNSARTGLPVQRAGSEANAGTAASKPQATVAHHGASSRFARPGRAFCSWSTTGIPSIPAAAAPGSEA